MKTWNKGLEVLNWIAIMASPALLGALIGVLIYFKWHTSAGKWIALIVFIAGLITGTLLATSIWRKHGTTNWISRYRKS
ncbi:MAG TPA: hypothetical protein VHK91_05225 [Flavisolibacter sp.]|jgi:hypothetical protein|nr:hypothetical protein [Flavisolibacter sp.]